MGWLGTTARAMAAALLLVACTEQSKVDVDAVVTLRGTVVDAAGAPMGSRPVTLGSGVTDLSGAVAVATLGAFCVTGECVGETFPTETDGDGRYQLELTGSDTQSGFGEALSFLLSTSGARPDGWATGPAASARFRIQTTDVSMPPLEVHDARPTISADGRSVALRWDPTALPAPSRASFLDRDGAVVWEATTDTTEHRVDGRVLEDRVGVAFVTATGGDEIEASSVELTWRSSGAGYHGGVGPAPSRGASCDALGPDGVIEPVVPCALTDGDFARTDIPFTICVDDAAGCVDSVAVRIAFVEPIAADLVVVRGCLDPCTIEPVAPDGTTGTPRQIDGYTGLAALDGTPIEAVVVRTASPENLTEVSTWSPVADGAVLVALDDPVAAAPEAVVGADDEDTSPNRRWIVIVSGIALVAVALAIGITIGRPRPAR